MTTNFYKTCAGCPTVLYYATKNALQKSIRTNAKCKPCSSKKIVEDTVTKILQLNESGLSNREISKQCGIHHNTVGYHLKKNNRKCNTANQPIDIIDEHNARCKKCSEIKSINEFQFGRKGQKYEYRFSYCNACRKKQKYLNLNNDINKFMKDRFNRLKRRCKKDKIHFSLSFEDYIEQYNNQKGLCFYTDVEMDWKVGEGCSRNALSVDKIIPEKGYIKGNFVFSCFKINTCKSDLSLEEMKQWMRPWYDRIVNFIT